MLRACRRVLKARAPFVFFVVSPTSGLSARDIEHAAEAGPTHVDAGPGYAELLAEAGFVDVEIVDVNDEYARTLSRSIQVREAEAAHLEDLVGADVFAESQASRRAELATVHSGLLQRSLVSAVRP